MGKREEQKEQRRIQILTVGLDSFVRKGYHGTKIRDIANDVGMSVGLMFHYFKSKEELYEELLKFAASSTNFAQQIDYTKSTPIDIVRDIAKFIFSSFTEYPQSMKYFLLVKQALTADYLTEEMQEIVQNADAIHALVPLISAGQASKDFKEGDPLALSMAYFSAIQGIAESLVIFPDLPIPDAEWVVDIIRR